MHPATGDRVALFARLWAEGVALSYAPRSDTVPTAPAPRISDKPRAAETPRPVPRARTIRVDPVTPVPVAAPSRPMFTTGAAGAVATLRSSMCRWPHGDPRDDDFRFCCEPVGSGSPYCPAHCAVAYDRIARKANRPDPRRLLN